LPCFICSAGCQSPKSPTDPLTRQKSETLPKRPVSRRRSGASSRR
jgi:hypothetical protein